MQTELIEVISLLLSTIQSSVLGTSCRSKFLDAYLLTVYHVHCQSDEVVVKVVVEARPLLMGSFMEVDAEDRAVYAEVASYDALKATLVAKLAEYNESNPGMDLVFFQQVRGSWMRSLDVELL